MQGDANTQERDRRGIAVSSVLVLFLCGAGDQSHGLDMLCKDSLLMNYSSRPSSI